MEPSAVLSVNNLSAGYRIKGRDKKVLEEISFSLYGGEMACLAGANGIGKSTLLKTVAGLIPSLGGDIDINDRPVKHYRRAELAKILSIVLTSKIPTGNLKAGELIALGRYPYTNWMGAGTRTDEEKIIEAMSLTGTSEFRLQPIHELSDGQLQKVLIARALAQDCAIILLDEPTAHLDLMNKIVVMNLLRDLARKTGKAILIATHELELAMQVSDRLLLLTGSHDILSGTPEDLVLKGIINKYIGHKEVDFDAGTGRFIPVRAEGQKIGLDSPDPVIAKWTRNALERCGYSVTSDPAAVSLTAEASGYEIIWKIRHQNTTETVHSIEELLNELKKIR